MEKNEITRNTKKSPFANKNTRRTQSTRFSISTADANLRSSHPRTIAGKFHLYTKSQEPSDAASSDRPDLRMSPTPSHGARGPKTGHRVTPSRPAARSGTEVGRGKRGRGLYAPRTPCTEYRCSLSRVGRSNTRWHTWHWVRPRCICMWQRYELTCWYTAPQVAHLYGPATHRRRSGRW